MLEHLLIALPAVFFVVDPPGAVPLFIAMTARDARPKVLSMALRACVTGALLLFFFAFFGALIFRLFGVTLAAFRVAGGILLMLTALDMLRAETAKTRTSDAETQEGVQKEDIAIVPLAMPVLSGPGSIATVMVLMADQDVYPRGLAVAIAIALTFVATYFILSMAQRLTRVLGQTGIAVTQRIFGLLLAALAIQFIADGAKALWGAR
ncbi:MAG: MarC family protein [Archangiaceae bacterium]|nr:MarC family protein [Archangiaceae bacterium]